MSVFNNMFPSDFEDNSYVYASFIKENQGIPKISFIKKVHELRPIGGTLRLQNEQWFDVEIYLKALGFLLESLCDNNNFLYSKEQQQEILVNERNRDSERGEYAPYFRVAVFNFLKKTGTYPLHMTYIGHVQGRDKSLTKHLFYIQECLTFMNNERVYLLSSSREYYQFRKIFTDTYSVGMFDLPYSVNHIYKGKFQAYYILLKKLIIFYNQKKSSKNKEGVKNFIKFLNETQETR